MRIVKSILIIFIFIGCTHSNKTPRGILSDDKMRFIIWDMLRADEYANNFLISDSTLDIKVEKAALYEQIFKLHSTKADVFKKSLTFYQTNPVLLKVIIDSLRIEERKAIENKYKPVTPLEDSLPKKPGANLSLPN